MPKKKTTVNTVTVETDVTVTEDQVLSVAKKEAERTFYEAAQVLCGHINKQFINSKGRLEDLPCALPRAHTGDHSAPYTHLVAEQGVKRDEKGNQVLYVSGYHEEQKTAYWSDAAGVPAIVREQTQAEDWERLKKSRNRERGVDDELSRKLDNEVKGSYGVQS